MIILINVLESILLGVLPCIQARPKLLPHILDCGHSPRVVCGKCRPSESLAQDLVAHANAVRVEVRREDLALSLQLVSWRAIL